MYELMDVTVSQVSSTIDNYFIAWKNYDIILLKQIFHPDALYEIKTKRTLHGINSIIAYWEKNSYRQKDIKLDYNTIEIYKDIARISFYADFFDIEENMFNVIIGEMTLVFDSSYRIILLSEAYSKLTGVTKPFKLYDTRFFKLSQNLFQT